MSIIQFLRSCHCSILDVPGHLWTPIVLQWASVTIGDSGTDFEKTSVNINRFSNKALLSPIVSSISFTNDLSIVCKLTYGQTSFLFGGDIEWEAEHDLAESGVNLRADVLKVSHHGSDTSSSYLYLRSVMPTYAIISVGAKNSYGHPSESVMSRLEDAGVIVMRTDQLGTIACISDELS